MAIGHNSELVKKLFELFGIDKIPKVFSVHIDITVGNPVILKIQSYATDENGELIMDTDEDGNKILRKEIGHYRLVKIDDKI